MPRMMSSGGWDFVCTRVCVSFALSACGVAVGAWHQFFVALSRELSQLKIMSRRYGWMYQAKRVARCTLQGALECANMQHLYTFVRGTQHSSIEIERCAKSPVLLLAVNRLETEEWEWCVRPHVGSYIATYSERVSDGVDRVCGVDWWRFAVSLCNDLDVGNMVVCLMCVKFLWRL